jgi:exosortase K
MRTRISALMIAALISWALKQHYAAARADELWWILAPTATVVGAMTGVSFAMQPGEGYFSSERLFLIEKSCAGVNFMIAAFAMLVFALRHHVGTILSAACMLGVSLIASYAAAVVTNAVRIAIALFLGAHPVALTAFRGADIHRIEGIVVYFGGLVLLYELTKSLDHRGCAARWSAGEDVRRAEARR